VVLSIHLRSLGACVSLWWLLLDVVFEGNGGVVGVVFFECVFGLCVEEL